jgi:cellulose biosynthesis protein BcsQ
VREALAASDIAIVVTTPSFFGAQGVDRAVATIQEVQRTLNPQLVFAGVIVNRVRSVVEEHSYRQQELVEVHGKHTMLTPAIPERVAIQQAESHGQPVQTIGTAGAREVREIFEEHLNRLIRKYQK